jgi:hypothetical protein
MAWNLGQMFDPYQGMGPDQVDQRRLLILSMLPRLGEARTVGQGLANLATGVVSGVQGRKLDKTEAAGRASADQVFQQAMGGWSPFAMGGGMDGMTGSAGGDTIQTGGNREEFIQAMMPHAIRVAQETGLDPRLVIAQAAQETGWGKHAPNSNYFGIKSHGKGGGATMGTTEYVNGRPVQTADSFRTYGGMGQSADDYAAFLKANPRYRDMLAAPDLNSQLAALGASGYATDPNYARAVGSIANSIPMPNGAAGPAGQPDLMTGGAGNAAPTGQAGGDTLGGGSAAIYQALANPWLTQEQRAALMMMLEQNDPLRQMQLREQQLRLQQMQQPAPPPASIQELQFRAQAAGLQPGSPEYQQFMLGGGKMPGADDVTYAVTPQLYTDETGQTRMGVLGNDGTFKPVELPPGAVLTKGYEKVDLGDRVGIVNTNTGEVITTIEKNVAEEAALRAEGAKTGEATADAKINLDAMINQGQQSLDLIHSIMTDPALPSITGMVQGRLPPMSQGGTDLNVKIQQLQGKTFLEAFATLKGGGAITEREGQAAQEAIARLNRAQSTDAYIKALNELAQIVQTGMARAKAKAGMTAPTAAPAAQSNVMRFDENGNLIQ